MIHLNNVSLQFGSKLIFEEVNWHIKAGARYALIGRNGAGKTTLFRMLIKEQYIDKGEIKQKGNLNIAYLPQEHHTTSKNSILNELLLDNKKLLDIQKRLSDLESQLEDGNDETLEKYTLLSTEFEHLGGFELETKAKMILSGIGFKREDFNKPVSEFSGGWKMRVYLSKLLLRNPDLLLLDEPTNHLDLPALIWLESYLSNFPGTLIIISHDRDFLNKVTNNITELSFYKINTYGGNYDFFLKKKAENENLIYKQYEKQQEEIENLKRFINKFKAKATKAAQARSRMKQLEKIEKNLIKLPQKTATIKFNIPFSTQSGKNVLEINSLNQQYGEKNKIFIDSNLTIYRDERAAVVGVNGIGKTTLLKVIANLVKYSGNIKLGHNVKFSYFGQHQIDELNVNNDIITEVESFADFDDIPNLRKLLGNFMFTGDDVFQKISTLSGGEKSRIALVKILLEKSNLLLLDEPTNHLDIETKELLLKALKEYKGTIIVVSHDKYFIKNLANKILLIKDKKIIKYEGGLDYYLEKSSLDEAQEDNSTSKITNISNKKEQKRYEAELRQRKSKKLKPLKTKLENLELKIEELELKKENSIQEMSDPSFYNQNSDYISQFNIDFKKIENDLNKLQENWEELYFEIEEIEESFT